MTVRSTAVRGCVPVLVAGLVLASWTAVSAGRATATAEAQVADLEKRLAGLEARLTAIENGRARIPAPFAIVDAAGKSLLTVTTGSGGKASVIFGEKGTGVEIGVGQTGAGFVEVHRADGSPAASIGPYRGGPTGFRVFAPDGQNVAASLRLSDSSRGLLTVGEETGGAVRVGVGASGAAFVSVSRSDSSEAISLGQRDGGAMALRVFDAAGNKAVAELGGDAGSQGGALTIDSGEGSPMLRVAGSVSSGDARVTIGAGQKGNVAVNVSNSSRAPVASFGEAGIGGGVFAAHSSSGTIRALLSGSVGELHLADESGTTRATVVGASSGGALSVRNASGTTIARMGEGQQGGMLQLANAGGSATVEAGTLPDGTGVVRAYPLGNPALGLVGMPGTFIMGFGGKK